MGGHPDAVPHHQPRWHTHPSWHGQSRRPRRHALPRGRLRLLHPRAGRRSGQEGRRRLSPRRLGDGHAIRRYAEACSSEDRAASQLQRLPLWSGGLDTTARPRLSTPGSTRRPARTPSARPNSSTTSGTTTPSTATRSLVAPSRATALARPRCPPRPPPPRWPTLRYM